MGAEEQERTTLGQWLAGVAPWVLAGLAIYKLFLAYVSRLFGSGRYVDHLLSVRLEDFVGIGITVSVVAYMAIHRK